MDEPSPTANDASPSLPRWLVTVLGYPPLERRSWGWSLAPAYIGLFLWVGFFDQFPRETLSRGTIGWTVVGAAVGGTLAYLLFFLPAASWGFEARRPLHVLATRTFGLSGAGWVPMTLAALLQIVWLAVSVRYGTDFCLSGLVLIRMLSPTTLEPWVVGGTTLPSPLYLATAFLWTYFIALAGRYLVRVIAALMNVYPVVVAIIMAVAMGLAFRGLPPASQGPFPLTGQAVPALAPATAAAVAVQMILGFFATASLVAADWGAICRTRDDVRFGGLVSVAFACWVVATIATLTVVGSLTRVGRLSVVGSLVPPPGLTYQAALRGLFNDWIAGGILIALSLTALAPGCYAAFLIGMRLHERFPRRPRTRWTLTGALSAYILLVLGVGTRMASVFAITGAIIAPILGAIAADARRTAGAWPGARRGINRPGFAAWFAGMAAGLIPLALDRAGSVVAPLAQFSVLAAYVVAFVVYSLLASLNLESATWSDAIPPPPQPETVTPAS